jgi:hypothetical protein
MQGISEGFSPVQVSAFCSIRDTHYGFPHHILLPSNQQVQALQRWEPYEYTSSLSFHNKLEKIQWGNSYKSSTTTKKTIYESLLEMSTLLKTGKLVCMYFHHPHGAC